MGGKQSSILNTPANDVDSEWQPSSTCTKHLQAARSDDTCMVKIAANAHFDINYRPTFQTLYSDKDTILYQSFSYDCQGKQLPAGIFNILRKSSSTLKSLTLNYLPNDCRVCIYDLFRKLQLDQYQQLEQLILSRMYKDECYIKLADDFSLPFNITHLTLRGIGLVAVPPVIKSLKSLTHLSLANNIITQISCLLEDEHSTLGNLVNLNIAENLLTIIPKDIDRLTQVKVLNLSYNCLKKSVPDSIRNMHCLTELYLQWNRLETVPTDAIAELKCLQLLNLSHNKLKKIAKDICFHPCLKFLNLSGNDGLIFQQTDSSHITSCLQELYISSILTCALPSFLTDLHQLTALDCENNQISNLDIILTIPNLQRANFHTNDISDCTKLFCHLHTNQETKLTTIDLSNNHLSTDNGEDSLQIHNTVIVLNVHSEPLCIAPRSLSQKTRLKHDSVHWWCCA